MEKYYQDYEWNLNSAQYWYKQIGKHKLAEERHKTHLAIAQAINEGFKQLFRKR